MKTKALYMTSKCTLIIKDRIYNVIPIAAFVIHCSQGNKWPSKGSPSAYRLLYVCNYLT